MTAKNFTLVFVLLFVSLAAFGQAVQPLYFNAYIYGLEDPPAAFTIGIFNPPNSGKNIVLDTYQFSAGFEANDTTGYIEVGTGVSTTQPASGTCATYPAINMDFTDPSQQIKRGATLLSVAKIFGQPCNVQIDTNNIGSNLGTVALSKFSPTYTVKRTIVLPPGKGYVIYLGQTFHGTWICGFEWHEQ